MTTTEAFNEQSAPAPLRHSRWHSPVPYLFGGLAAMLGLIAFALLILACSYWKLSSHPDDADGGERDVESGDTHFEDKPKSQPELEQKFLVIMAGQHRPSFLATPISTKPSSFPTNTATEKPQNAKAEADAES